MMSKEFLHHKGFTGSIEASVDDDCLHGRVLFIDDLITYEGERVADLKAAFIDAVDRYVDYCSKNGKEPNKPYSGSFNVRTGSDLHRAAAISAAKANETLNEHVCKAIRCYVEPQNERVEHFHTITIAVQRDEEKHTTRWLSSSFPKSFWGGADVQGRTTH